MSETIDAKELAKLLHCSLRTIQRHLNRADADSLPQGRQFAGKWIWVKSEVIQWLSPQHSTPALTTGSLAELATHQLGQKNPRS